MNKVFKFFSLFMALVLCVSLASCAPKDPVDAKAKLEGKDYVVVVDGTVIPTTLKVVGINGVESVVSATKTIKAEKEGEEDKIETVFAVLFAEKAQAKDSVSKLAEWAKKNGHESNFKQAGKWLYAGTEKGMKDFN